ncbi:DUF3987 domain-containing protein [bacterium]|nr:DUF3987 domain-containing protein [bacterium]
MKSKSMKSSERAELYASKGFYLTPLHRRDAKGICCCPKREQCSFESLHARIDDAGDIIITNVEVVARKLWERTDDEIGLVTGKSRLVAVRCDNPYTAVEFSRLGTVGVPHSIQETNEAIYLFLTDEVIESRSGIGGVEGVHFHGTDDWVRAPVLDASQLESIPEMPSWLLEILGESLTSDKVSTFPADIFPAQIQRLISEGAASMCCPPELIGIPLLGVCASAIGVTRRIEMKENYYEYPSLYCAVIAPPGSSKSPAMGLATGPVEKHQQQLIKQFQLEKAEYEQQRREFALITARWSSLRSLFLKGGGEDPGAKPAYPDTPNLVQKYTTDITNQSLTELLQKNPRGVLVIRDELSTWIATRDRDFWLSAWSAKPIIVNRKNEVPITVPTPIVNVIGNLTPAAVNSMIKSAKNSGGFLERLLVCVAECVPDWQFSTESVSTTTIQEYDEIYTKLAGLEGDRVTMRLTRDAFRAYIEALNEPRTPSASKEMEAFMDGQAAKLAGYLGRFALILHLIRMAAGETESDEVDLESMNRAIQLTIYFRAQAKKLYGADESSSANDRTEKVRRWIENRGGAATAREIQKANVAGIRTSREANEVLQVLQSLQLGHIEVGPRGKREFHLYRMMPHQSAREPEENILTKYLKGIIG